MALSLKFVLATTIAFGPPVSALRANCSGRPEQVAGEFTAALDNVDYNSAYELLSNQTKDSISIGDFREHYLSRNKELGGPSLPKLLSNNRQVGYGRAFKRTMDETRQTGPNEWTISFMAQYLNQPVHEEVSVTCEQGGFRVLNFKG